MTTQVAVLNLGCVAVASDSVVTLESGRDRRTWASAEKIVEIGDGHDLVVMTCGQAVFMKVPWSVLIDEWSRSLNGPLPSVPHYAGNFQDWLRRRGDLINRDRQDDFFGWQVRDFFLSIRQRIIEGLRAAALTDDDWASIDVQATVNGAVREGIDDLAERDALLDIDAALDADYVRASERLVREQFDYVFDDVPRTMRSDASLLAEVPALLLAKNESWSCDAVVTFIGYGSEDVFPVVQAVTFHGVVNDAVRAARWEPVSVDTEDAARIVPFGQVDAIGTFVNAHDREFLVEAHRCIDSVWDDTSLVVSDANEEQVAESTSTSAFREALHQRLDAAFAELAHERFELPLLSAIEALPRIDLASMAESLVDVQVLRSASVTRMPTVGGPIDVVIISRTHGVEWVRRKALDRAGQS